MKKNAKLSEVEYIVPIEVLGFSNVGKISLIYQLQVLEKNVPNFPAPALARKIIYFYFNYFFRIGYDPHVHLYFTISGILITGTLSATGDPDIFFT